MKRIDLSEKQKFDAQKILSGFKSFSAFSRDKVAAYKFTNIIGIKVCPYCNIEYVYTVYDEHGKQVVRPDIDHFIPKNKDTGNPKLQLELTNLIPSCFACNERLKRDIAFSRDTHIHPYFDDFDSIMYFRINIADTNYLNEENINICIERRNDAKSEDVKRALANIQVFKLKERYQFHKNEVVMLFKRIKAYNKAKIKEIEDLVSGGDKNSVDLSFLFPEKYCDINNTSLGKLKKDLLEIYL